MENIEVKDSIPKIEIPNKYLWKNLKTGTEEVIAILPWWRLLHIRKEIIKRLKQKRNSELLFLDKLDLVDTRLEKLGKVIPKDDWQDFGHMESHIRVSIIPTEILIAELKSRVKHKKLSFTDLQANLMNSLHNELKNVKS